ncbi:MAG: hypothetical protein IJG82_10450 [Atopobiaceae bacterium]|nr:hypothetical protein [Atopobiaceae bacterium]
MQESAAASSRYRDVSAQKAAGSWRARVGIIDAVAIALIALISLGYILTPDLPPHMFWVLLVAFVCILYTQWMLKAKNSNELVKIDTHDCDPAKLVKVIDMIESALFNKRARQSFHTVYAVCCAQMGYDDIALEWADHIEAENPRDFQIRLMLVNVRTTVAKHRNDAGTLQMMRSHAEAFRAGARNNAALLSAIDAMVAAVDRKLALMAGNYARVRELNDVIGRYAVMPQAKVSNEYDRAELEDALGNTAAALPHYAYVAEHGGTLMVQRLAQEWIDAHSLGE